MSHEVCDFARSFLTFRLDFAKKPPATVSHQPPYSLNNARIQLDCRCRITEKQTGTVQTFVLGASCKTERVGVERDIWTEPNADFTPIFSMDRFLALKTFARAGVEVDLYPPGSGKQSDRQLGLIADIFDGFGISFGECDAELLTSPREIVEAVLARSPLVAQTELDSDRYTAMIEYPVKTINANERDGIYQTDTGPHLFPDLTRKPDKLIEGMELAFSAFNCPEWAEFLIRVPTPIAESVHVYHYSRTVRLDCRNRLFRLT
ncbi:MAG: hypothetical protein KF861_10635 [Planctomycetaceae bacterium]|nr:hypothetical protein [Planctomycetaceae bacterium]